MSLNNKRYCLDTNVLIQAWQKYYSPKLCPDYWAVLDELGSQGIIFIPQMVNEEILRIDDDLSQWVRTSKIAVAKADTNVTNLLKVIFAADPVHKNLVDNTKQRSLADPWIIAHAINENATVVTKEVKVSAANTNKIKIPNVCDNMGIPWISDFDLIERLNIRFFCSIVTKQD